MRKLKKEDKAQVEYYMKLVDQELKEIHHNHTIGIIVNFVHQDDIVPLSYELSHI